MMTLKYRPFSVPGSPDYNATMNGWNTYVRNVAKFAAETLGTTQAADKGFDMEIWNELTFGSQFLSINNYYAKAPFVRVVEHLPATKDCAGSNFLDVTVRVVRDRVVVLVCEDNLVRGASGVAVQNFNRMYGHDERTALL